jgi:quercetin dioxygenase-like cupin family protein
VADAKNAGPGFVKIPRDELPTLREVVVDGKTHNLGIHKDFRRHPVLKEFLPENARLSFAWVKLGVGEELAVHAHPTATLIVIATGNGSSQGDLETTFTDGDVLIVSPGYKHGFRGEAPAGYWAFSIQLEGSGLYEDTSSARVVFSDGSPVTSPGLVKLVALNNQLMERHTTGPLFVLLNSPGQLKDNEKRAQLFDAFQVWSNFFQKMVRLRTVLDDRGEFGDAAENHLAEEFQHNLNLQKDRGNSLRVVWDPQLEAASSWFVWKMFTSGSAARAALVHLVVEGGASVTHGRAMQVFGETDYFKEHNELDPDHLRQGYDLLKGLPEPMYAELEGVIREGWDMLDLITARFAAVGRGEAGR